MNTDLTVQFRWATREGQFSIRYNCRFRWAMRGAVSCSGTPEQRFDGRYPSTGTGPLFDNVWLLCRVTPVKFCWGRGVNRVGFSMAFQTSLVLAMPPSTPSSTLLSYLS